MGREIHWNNVAPADFTSANQMFKYQHDLQQQSVKAFDEAVAKATKAVEDRNNALVNQYINSFGLEDWNKPETKQNIDNFIQDIHQSSGGMLNYGAITETLDKRQDVLRNSELFDKEVGLALMKFNKAQEDELAGDLAGSYVLGKDITKDPRYSSASDRTKAKVVLDVGDYRNKVGSHKVIDSNNMTTLVDNEYKQYGSVLENLFQRDLELNDIINNPNSTPEQKASAQTALNANSIKLFEVSRTLHPNTVNRASNTVNDKHYKKTSEQVRFDAEQHHKNREFGLKEKIYNHGVEQDNIHNELESAKIGIDIIKAQGGISPNDGGSAFLKSALGKELNSNGYSPQILSRSNFDHFAVANTFVGNIVSFRQNLKSTQDSQNFNTYLGTSDADASKNKYLMSSGEWGFGTKNADLITYLQSRKDLTDAEKIKVHQMAVKGNAGSLYNWFGARDADDFVNEVIGDVRNGLKREREETEKQYFQKQINLLMKATGMNESDLMIALGGYVDGSGRVHATNLPNEIRNMFSQHAKDSYNKFYMTKKDEYLKKVRKKK